jgi:hypothetical protein
MANRSLLIASRIASIRSSMEATSMAFSAFTSMNASTAMRVIVAPRSAIWLIRSTNGTLISCSFEVAIFARWAAWSPIRSRLDTIFMPAMMCRM